MMLVIAYMSSEKNAKWTEDHVLALCGNTSTWSPIPGLSAEQLLQECYVELNAKLDYLICWVAIRAAFQV